MDKTELKLYNQSGIIAYIIVMVCSIAVVAISIIAVITNPHILGAMIVFGIFGLISFVFSVMALVWFFKSQTIINNETIKCYNHIGLIKTMKIDNVKRIVIYSVTRLGGKISRIILDDGTFDVNADPSSVLTNAGKSITSESWISFEYSEKRLTLLQNRFSYIQVESIQRKY